MQPDTFLGICHKKFILKHKFMENLMKEKNNEEKVYQFCFKKDEIDALSGNVADVKFLLKED